MDDHRLGNLVRAVRLRRGLRQLDLASLSGRSQECVSLVERGHLRTLSLATVRQIAAPLDRIDVAGRWRGGNADRLLSRGHSLLAESFASFLSTCPGWLSQPEVSFAIYGERGVIDQLAWHSEFTHLLIVEFKTGFIDVNEMLGTLDRKVRLATRIGLERGWRADKVSAWLVVSDTHTNRRHAAQHSTLLRSRLALDGRTLRAFLRRPSEPTTGVTFWPVTNTRGTDPGRRRTRAVGTAR